MNNDQTPATHAIRPSSRRSRRLAPIAGLIVGLLSGPASSEVAGSGADAEGCTGTLGAGPVLFPRYPGGTTWQALPLPLAYVSCDDRVRVDLFRATAYLWGSPDRKQGVGIALEPRLGRRAGDGARLAGMATRRASAFAGPTWDVEGAAGSMSIGYFRDLGHASGGDYVDVLLDRTIAADSRWDVSASLELTRTGSRFTRYYFGVTPDEAAAARPAYAPGAATHATLWLTGQYAWAKPYVVMFGANVMRLGGSAAASPIVERRSVPMLYLGLGIAF